MRLPWHRCAAAQRGLQAGIAHRGAAAAQQTQQIAGRRLLGCRIGEPVRPGSAVVVGAADVIQMPRGAMKTAQPRLRHHPGNESGRPWVVDQKCTAVAGGVARAIQCHAARCARPAAHRRKRAAVAPVACNALPGDHAVIGQIARFGFGDAQAGQAPLGIDKRTLPQPVLIAGAAHDGGRGGTRSEPWRDIAHLRSRSATSDTCQQEADPRPRFDGHCRSCMETSQQAARAGCAHA